MNITMALYSTSWKIEPVEILAVHSILWCACEVDSYKIMFLAPYPVTKLFEFQEGYHLHNGQRWVCVRFFTSCGNRIIKFKFSRIVRGNRK